MVRGLILCAAPPPPAFINSLTNRPIVAPDCVVPAVNVRPYG